MRGIGRITGCSTNTVNSLLVSVGNACDKYHYMNVTGLSCKNVQVDEIWAFCYAKAKTKTKNPEAGDAWTWTAVDPDSKMVIAWHTGDRGLDSGRRFMLNLHSRLNNRIQLSSDGHHSYVQAVQAAFGGDVDFGMLVKNYNGETLDMVKTSVIGNPKFENISTSHVERQNLSMRMGMRRFTRRTNAHSKKLENHKLALALYFLYHNFIRICFLKAPISLALRLAKSPMLK